MRRRNDNDKRNDLTEALLNKGKQVRLCPVVRSNVLRRTDHLAMSPAASFTVNRTIHSYLSSDPGSVMLGSLPHLGREIMGNETSSNWDLCEYMSHCFWNESK